VEEPRTFGTAPPEAPALADLGPVRLLSADVRGRRDDRWDVRLRWQGDERTQISYTVFLQLLDPQGRVRGQVDAVPQGGGYPTMWWLPGEVVDDELTIELAPDAPPGPYRLITGLYDPATGTRLMDAATGKDFVEIATMERK
jgi:hypothetical protein